MPTEAVPSSEGLDIQLGETTTLEQSEEQNPELKPEQEQALTNFIIQMATLSDAQIEKSSEFRELTNKEKVRNILKKTAVRAGIGVLFAGATVALGGVPIVAAATSVLGGLAASSIARGGVDVVRRVKSYEKDEATVREELYKADTERLKKAKELASEAINSHWEPDKILSFVEYINQSQTERVSEGSVYKELREQLKATEKKWKWVKIGTSVAFGVLAGGGIAELFRDKIEHVVAENGIQGSEGLSHAIEHYGVQGAGEHTAHALGGDMNNVVFDYTPDELRQIADAMSSHGELTQEFLTTPEAQELFSQGMHEMGSEGTRIFAEHVGAIAGERATDLALAATGAVLTSEAVDIAMGDGRQTKKGHEVSKKFDRGASMIAENYSSMNQQFSKEATSRRMNELNQNYENFPPIDSVLTLLREYDIPGHITIPAGSKVKLAGFNENGDPLITPLDESGKPTEGTNVIPVKIQNFVILFGINSKSAINPQGEATHQFTEEELKVARGEEEKEPPVSLTETQIRESFERGAKWVPAAKRRRILSEEVVENAEGRYSPLGEAELRWTEDIDELQVITPPGEKGVNNDQIIMKSRHNKLHRLSLESLIGAFKPESMALLTPEAKVDAYNGYERYIEELSKKPIATEPPSPNPNPEPEPEPTLEPNSNPEPTPNSEDNKDVQDEEFFSRMAEKYNDQIADCFKPGGKWVPLSLEDKVEMQMDTGKGGAPEFYYSTKSAEANADNLRPFSPYQHVLAEYEIVNAFGSGDTADNEVALRILENGREQIAYVKAPSLLRALKPASWSDNWASMKTRDVFLKWIAEGRGNGINADSNKVKPPENNPPELGPDLELTSNPEPMPKPESENIPAPNINPPTNEPTLDFGNETPLEPNNPPVSEPIVESAPNNEEENSNLNLEWKGQKFNIKIGDRWKVKETKRGKPEKRTIEGIQKDPDGKIRIKFAELSDYTDPDNIVSWAEFFARAKKINGEKK